MLDRRRSGTGSTDTPNFPDKCGLARPAGTDNQDNRRIIKRILYPLLREPREHAISKISLIGSQSPANWKMHMLWLFEN